MTSKKCEYCNTLIEEDATFCSECGTELSFPATKSYANLVEESGSYTQPTAQSGSSQTQLMYAQQDKDGQQQGKNYKRNRVMSRMISRIISFAIMIAILYALTTLFSN
ncbi:MAG: zinc ribbon domain-containing protein [Candidatus Heimdallarchaeota archaeon]|nr:zinc ribbon domain-containing protein [Candidatus Heimdallarchaeota archaeon]